MADYRRLAIQSAVYQQVQTDRWILRCADRCDAVLRCTQGDSILSMGRRRLADRAIAAGWDLTADGSLLCPACIAAWRAQFEAGVGDGGT